MKTKLYIFLLLIYFAGFSTAQKVEEAKTNQLFNITNLKSNLEFLASDELKGRKTATNSAKVASKFIAAEFEKYGIKPLGDSGTYFENFDLVVSSKNDSSKITFIDSSSSSQTLNFGDDFLFFRTSKSVISKFPFNIVFVGYGISSPKDNYDDYKNIDVKGKAVLLISGKPKDINFAKKLSSYRLEISKGKTAKEKGAAAVILIDGNKNDFSMWNSLRSWTSSPDYELKDSVKNSDEIPAIYLSERGVTKFLQKGNYDYDKLISLAVQKVFNPFQLNQKIKLSLKMNEEIKSARNVVGLIEGNDPYLKNQYVAISAHYDHLGEKNGVIYNGADDDGSGTVAVLEAARTLALSGKNKRSFLFILHTGEEEGLLGSEYFVDNNSLVKNIITDINLDMVGRGSVDSIYSVGSGKLSSELKNLVEKTNRETVNFVLNYKYDDPNDPERIYYRSDHYNYAERGIPIVFFTESGGGDYHLPTDDVEKINFNKILKIVSLVYHTALNISNGNHKFFLDKKSYN